MRIRMRASAFLWLVAALLIGVSVLRLWEEHRAVKAAQPSAQTALAATPMPTRGTGDRSRATDSHSSANPTPPPTAAAHTIEICGSGAVAVASDDPAEINRYVAARMQPAAHRWETTMLSSDSYRARAVGTYIQAMRANSLGPDAACTGDDAACGRGGNSLAIFEQRRDELAQIALEVSDPAVFAIAARTCEVGLGKPTPGDCQRLTPQRWIQIDSDNAEPWLLLAASAHSQGALDQETEAVEHAAAAHSFNNYGDSLYAFSAPSMPNEATPFERAWLAGQLVGFIAAWPRPEYAYLRTYCSATALKEDRVRRQCEALAQLLRNKGNTILDLSMSRVLGQQLGWPQRQLDHIKEETQALMMTSWEDPGPPSWNCRRVDRYNEYFDQLSRMSELDAARATAAHSGVSIPDLARQFTERLQRLTHN